MPVEVVTLITLILVTVDVFHNRYLLSFIIIHIAMGKNKNICKQFYKKEHSTNINDYKIIL